MRTFAAGVLQRGPRRSQLGETARPHRRGELAAGLGTTALVAELLLLPAAVPVSLVLLAVGRVARWRPEWLLLPLLAGVGWLAAAGPRWGMTTMAARGGQLLSGVTHAAADPALLLRDPGGAAATALAWLPRELPAALVTGAVQAGLLTWFSCRRSGGNWRPGLIAAGRRWRGRGLLAAGQVVTGTGCAVGLDTRTGRLARLSWAEAERGVLLTATDPGELSTVALAVVCAAMRRRKAVLVFDFDVRSNAAALAEPVALLASALGMPQFRMPRSDGAVRTAVGQAIRARGVLLASGPGALLTGEVTGALALLRERGLRGDSLLCLTGCEAVDPASLAALFGLGPSTGTGMLACTTSALCADALAGLVGPTLACGPVGPELAARMAAVRVLAGRDKGLTADTLTRQPRGEFTVIAADYVRPGCRSVPITALAASASARPRGARLAAANVPAAAGSR
jgi:hypothetical protein